MRIGLATLAVVAGGFFAARDLAAADPTPVETVTVTVTTASTFQHRGVHWWARRATQARKDSNVRGRTIRRLRRVLAHSPTVSEAVALARVVYGVDQSRRVRCESHGYVFAHNPSGASSILQFLPSTWASTPFAGFSIWSPYAQALAGGWMVRAGRSREWQCSL